MRAELRRLRRSQINPALLRSRWARKLDSISDQLDRLRGMMDEHNAPEANELSGLVYRLAVLATVLREGTPASTDDLRAPQTPRVTESGFRDVGGSRGG